MHEVTPRYCSSWFAAYDLAGSTGERYRCMLIGPNAPYCPCKSFQFSPFDRRWCKHLERISNEACLWSAAFGKIETEVTLAPAAIDDRHIVEGEFCPGCGAPIYAPPVEMIRPR